MGCYPSTSASQFHPGSEPPSPVPPGCCTGTRVNSGGLRQGKGKGWAEPCQSSDANAESSAMPTTDNSATEQGSPVASAKPAVDDLITPIDDVSKSEDTAMLQPSLPHAIELSPEPMVNTVSQPSAIPVKQQESDNATSENANKEVTNCNEVVESASEDGPTSLNPSVDPTTLDDGSPHPTQPSTSEPADTQPSASDTCNTEPSTNVPTTAPPKYGASIPIGGGKFVPVGTGAGAIPVASKIDFESEKSKIEEEFTKLEEQLDAGTRDRKDIEKEFDALTHKADTLRRLQEAEVAASRAQLAPRATPLAPLAPVRVSIQQAPRDPATPSMAVVHWKKVTKEQFLEYRTILIDKYGSGTDAIKSIERIPNRILITAPVAAVMAKILADEDLDPRPEPYQLPSKKKLEPLPKPVVLPPANGPAV